MSKSDADPKSRILITDSNDDIHAKVRSAITDSQAGISFDPQRRPGVSNLIEILKHVTQSRESSEFIAKDNEFVSMRAFKEMVADEIIRELQGIRENFHEIINKNQRLRDDMAWGATKAWRQAQKTMGNVREAMGLDRLVLSDEEAADLQARRKASAEAEPGSHPAVRHHPWELENEGEGRELALEEGRELDLEGGREMDLEEGQELDLEEDLFAQDEMPKTEGAEEEELIDEPLEGVTLESLRRDTKR